MQQSVINNPLITIISPISMDHADFLGNTIEKIATEKLGIKKPNCPMVISKQKNKIIKLIKNKIDNKCYYFNEDFLVKKASKEYSLKIQGEEIKFPIPPLIGKHQIENASTAIATLKIQNKLKVTQENIYNGIKNTKWSARIEQIIQGKLYKLIPNNCDLFVDGGHNEDAAKIITNWINNDNKKQYNPKTFFIFAMLKSKDNYSYLKHISNISDALISMEIRNEADSRTNKDNIHTAMSLKINPVKQATSFEESFKIISNLNKNHQGYARINNMWFTLFRRTIFNKK